MISPNQISKLAQRPIVLGILNRVWLPDHFAIQRAVPVRVWNACLWVDLSVGGTLDTGSIPYEAYL